MTARPSIPFLLFAVADAISRGGLPDPTTVEVYDRNGVEIVEITTATHTNLHRWAKRTGVTVAAWDSQPYTRDGVPHTLTNAYGRWHGAHLRLHCCEPVTSDTTAPAVLKAVAS